MLNIPSKKKLNKKDLLKYFQNNTPNQTRIGIEFEKLGVFNSTNLAVSYSQIQCVLEKLSEFENYQRIFNNEQKEKLIGLKNDYSAITLEPGSQFELSLAPQSDLKILDKQIKAHNNLVTEIANDLGIIWLGAGLQPLSTFENIKIIPKKRYEIMSEYLPKKGELPLVMMRETAGIQVGIDYDNEEDAIKKLKLSIKLSPIISATFANSPIRNGKFSGYKSFRSYSWTKTDEQRCGLISEKLFDKNLNFTFEDYIQTICETPMIMINQNGSQVKAKNITFDEYLENGYQGTYPNFEDFLTHASLCFTDVRLKNYLEIRNHDSQKSEFIMCIPAFWKGIIYNQEAQNNINEILKKLSYEDFVNLRLNTPIWGLDYKIKKYELADLVKEIFYISYNSLKLTGEEKYLEPILELIKDKMTPADIIIKNFNGLWNQDLNKFIQYSKF